MLIVFFNRANLLVRCDRGRPINETRLNATICFLCSQERCLPGTVSAAAWYRSSCQLAQHASAKSTAAPSAYAATSCTGEWDHPVLSGFSGVTYSERENVKDKRINRKVVVESTQIFCVYNNNNYYYYYSGALFCRNKFVYINIIF